MIITVVVAAIVIFGAYFYFKKSQKPQESPAIQMRNQQTATPAAEEKIITYTDNGYSPTTFKIKKGETVIFKNKSSQLMWTASAVHPTHRVYPTTGGCLGSTFDACQGVQPDSSWSFKFDIAGTWKYHNHSNPSRTGTIIVE